MFNINKLDKEERIKKIFNFEDCFEKKEYKDKIKDCNYISIKGNFVKGKVLLHKAALYIKLEKKIFD